MALVVGSALTVLAIGILFATQQSLRAATYTWLQSSWSGGATGNTATHPGNQSGWNQYSAKDASVTAGSTVTLGVQAGYALDSSDRDFNLGGTAWYSASWGYRRNLTISHSLVSGSSDLTNFPFLVRIESDNDLRTVANGGFVGKSDGSDIVFTSIDGTTKLSHQIESYTATTGALVAWVKIPTFSYTVDTGLNIYYGNAGAADQQDAANVWDSNYKAVYHLKETPSGAAGEILDSTSNANNGQTQGGMASGNQIAGLMGGSLSFDGTDDNVTVPHSSNLEITSNLTISAWVKADDISHLIASKASGDAAANSYEYRVTTRDYYLTLNGTAYQCDTFSDCFPRASQWKYATVTWNQSGDGAISYYENGKLLDTANRGTVLTASAAALVLAGRNDASTVRSLQGQLDEVRISNTVRSADWIATEYNNQRTSTVANGPRSQVITGLSSYRENQYGAGQRKIAFMPNATGGPAWYVALNKVNVVQYKKCLASTLCDQDADWSAAVNVDVDGDAGDYTPTMVVDGNYIIFVWDDDATAGTAPGSDTVDTIQMRRLDTTNDSWSAECSSAAITDLNPDMLMFAGKGSNNDFIVGYSQTSGGPLGIYEVTHNWTCATEGTGFTDISGAGMLDGFGSSGDSYVSIHFSGDVASVLYKDGFTNISQSAYNVSTNSWVFGHKTIVSAFNQVSATSDGSSIWLVYWQTNGSDLRMKKCSGTCMTQLATAWTTETSPWETGLGPYFAYTPNVGYISDTNELKVCLSNYTINDSHADVWCKTSDAASISWSAAVQLGLPGGGYNDVSIPYSAPSSGFAASAVGGSSAHWFIAPEQKVKQSRPTGASFIDAAEGQWGSNGRQIAYMPNATGGPAWYAFHADTSRIRYRKCLEATGCDADGDWSADVDVDSGLGNYNPNIAVSGDTIWASWIDDSADTIEFRALDTTTDGLGSACTSPSQGTIDFGNYPYIAAGTNGDVVVGYDSVSSDTEEGLFEVTSGGCSFTSIFSGSGLPDANSANLPVPVAIGNTIHLVYDDGANVINHSAYDVFLNAWALTDQVADAGSVLDPFFSVTTDGRNLFLLYQESADVYVVRTCTTSGGTPCMSSGAGTWSTLTSPYGSGSGLINSQWPTLTYRPSTNALTACLIRGPGVSLQDVTCRTTNATTVSWGAQVAAGLVPANLSNLSAPMFSGTSRDLEVLAVDGTNGALRFAAASPAPQALAGGSAYVAGGSATAVVNYDSGGAVALTKSGSTYSASGTFQSRTIDTVTGGSWGALTYSSSVPANTTLSVKVRSGNSANLSDAPPFTPGITFVQDETDFNNASAASIAKVFGSAVTTGNLIVVTVGWGTTDQTPTVTDSAGNTYTLIDKYFDTGGFNQGHATYYAKNVTGGTVTVTATFSPSVDYRRLAISEYRGADKTAPLDVHAIQRQIGPGTGTDAVTSGTVVTTFANELIYGSSQDIEAGGTLVAGTGFQLREATTGIWLATEDKALAVAGSTAATFTAGTGTSDKITAIATFKPDTSVVCSAITSGQAASTGGCVTDGHRYVQYQATLTTSDTTKTPQLGSLTLAYVLNGIGTLTSSPYDSADGANTLASVAWSQSGNGTAKFQLRTSPDGATWTAWLGPTGTGDYYTNSAGGETIHTTHRDGASDRYFQYRLSLASTDTAAPITVSSISTTYVVNAPPEFQAAPTATQNADGTVTINYSVRDPDTNTGSTDPGFITPSFEVSTNNGANWNPISAGLPAGTTTHKAVQQVSYTAYEVAWNAKAMLDGTYAPQTLVRITANDLEAANNLAVGTSASFALDVKNPVPGSPALSVNASTTPATIGLSATDDTALTACVTLDNTQTNCIPYVASTTLALATDPDTVYVIYRDANGNTASATATSPETPTKLFIRDVSNVPDATYQLFMAWKVSSVPVPNFSQYRVLRSTDGITYAQVATIADRAINYFLDQGLPADATRYYRIATADTAGNVSYQSVAVNGTANGQGGGSDSTPPTISAVTEGSLTTQSVRIAWDTDELADSTVGFSVTPGSYTTEVGVATLADSNAGVGAHSVTLTNLAPNTTYHYRVRSTDPDGNATTDDNGGAGYSFTTLDGPKITNVTTPSIRNTSATVSWLTDVAADSTVVYSANADLSDSTTVQRTADNGTEHSVVLSGLSAGTVYYYRVASGVATDDNGGAYYSFRTTSDTAAPVLQNVRAEDITGTTATVRWETDEGANSFVQFGPTGGATLVVGGWEYVTTHGVALDELVPDTEYTVQAVSADASGNISLADPITFRTAVLTDDELQVLVDEKLEELSGIGSGLLPTLGGAPQVTVTATSATITWTTDRNANGLVAYATDGEFQLRDAYAQVVGDPDAAATSHTVALANLLPDTLYHFQVRSRASVGDYAATADTTFRTARRTFSVETFTVEQVDDQTAIFRWSTNEDSGSTVRYTPYRAGALSTEEARTAEEPKPTILHQVTVLDFEPGVRYAVELRSANAAGQVATQVIDPFQTDAPETPPTITRIQVDSALATGERDRVQTVVSWFTDKLSTSRVYYRAGVGRADEELTESSDLDPGYTKKHVVVLTSFTPGAVYQLRVESIDSSEQRTLSNPITILTPQRQQSVFQVIQGAFLKTFGWVNLFGG